MKKIISILISSILLSVFCAGIHAQSKEVVAVYYFTSAPDYSYDYAEGVGNAVEAGVLRSKRFTVVERSRFGAIKAEEKFKEANTSDIVRKASKFGATTILTGHVNSVSQGGLVDSRGVSTGRDYVDISLSFKIIDVASGEIKKSENVSGHGEGGTTTEALQNAYLAIDKIIRAHVADYLPQRFRFLSIVSTKTKKDGDYLFQFKIWGGAEEGLKADDVVDIYKIALLTNPDTHKQVEEKTLLGQAHIIQVSGTSTCEVINPKKAGTVILNEINNNLTSVSIEYKGNWFEQRTWLDILNGKR